jgi:hypothetical protein
MAAPPKPRVPLPGGYRQGVITAITVVIGFSLLFLRYWGFEAPGRVTPASLATGAILLVAVLLQFYTLWRSLQVEDDDESTYRTTLRWFLASIFTLLASVVLAALVAANLVGA